MSRWYIIHAYSGFENKVRDAIMSEANRLGLTNFVEAISRVHWPTLKETWVTAIMVMIMTSLLALFFYGVDAFFSTLVKFLLGLLAKSPTPQG